ncbi:MAG: hypothetical protein EAS51_06600 [Microbacteriaceae bacterium]|nr:MAG: hypothetical protein EAS51_06600 [Microbacteriaceae bacterium]
MNVRLGIVCPESSREAFATAADTLSGVTPVWITYVEEKDIAERVREALAQCDCVCFSGELPFAACRDILPPELPTSVVRLTSVDLAVTLYRAATSRLDTSRFSVDTIDPGIVTELAAELDIPRDGIASLPHGRAVTVDQVLDFHTTAHRDRGTSFAITGRSNAVTPLSERLDVPVFPAVPVVPSIRVAMNRATLGAVSHKHSEMRFAAALFRVLDRGDLIESELRRLDLARAIHELPAFDGAWVEARGGGQDILVFAHKGLMQRLTDHWTTAAVLTDLQKSLRLKIAVGFGLGETARKSVEFAETATRLAADEGSGTAYLVSEDGVVIGPMSVDGGQTPRYHLSTDNSQVANLAHRLGLGVDTVAHLVDLEQETAGQPVVAEDIASKLRLTPASGRRIIRTLRKHNVVSHVGTTHTSGPGRPTNLYTLHLAEQLRMPGP